ncbi:ATP-dependent DNA helicase RecQ [Bacillus mesophilus]|uniref:DNA helicase RecQ n=1 Tax=Bacillus mesophilus TaxID=1808955 RepID=UPI0030846635|nr:ATP-dependent DNA helicase RecQ [Bacillus mesophilus]
MGECCILQAAEGMLKKYFGYDSFRSGQAEVIEKALNGSNSLVLMPTGGGKSVCYQIPALLMEGITIVISPLISLMKDQVDSLNLINIPATYINSSLTQTEVNERLYAAQNGEYKLIYVAPERFESPQFCSLLENLRVEMIAVDEAHCVSQWGHDFRPSYRTLSQVIQSLPTSPIILALTATATNEVVDDICNLLSIERENVTTTGFKRENLILSVEKGVDKLAFIKGYVSKNKAKPGIIYASTRKDVDKVHSVLAKQGYLVSKYHAGLNEEDRKKAQEAFLFDQTDIMVATNAFGMGINKSNVRYVIHYQLPRTIEAYYQEAGRAGRDGELSECILLFSPQDSHLQKFLIEQTLLNPELKQQEYKKLQAMVDFCHTEQCLQVNLLDYFNENEQYDNCQSCSNCKDGRERIDITKDAQIIFSCIKRMNERFGMTLVAQVLKGSKNKRVLEFGFQKLSTYGLLSKYAEKEISAMIQYLIAEGYLALSEGQYPVVSLTKESLPVLLGQVQIFKRGLTVPTKQRPESNSDLFDRLRELRKQIAQEESVPPFVIFSDRTLRELCEIKPVSMDEIIEVKGIGEQKRDKYGERFLLVIHQYMEDESKKIQAKESVENLEDQQPSHLVSYTLFQEGLSVKEISLQRERSLVTIQNHMIQAIEEGYEINWSDVLSDEEEKLIGEQIAKVGDEKLKPIKELLPDEIDYFKIKLALTKIKISEVEKASC